MIMPVYVCSEHVLKSVLALFMTKGEASPYDPEHLPLPTYEEVLVCNSETTAEEVVSQLHFFVLSILIFISVYITGRNFISKSF